ncbi:MAG: YchF/TatD family DNA exonuclease [Polyangiaceae bacterium]|nr:YchF/TatD family DNA exonuclease [Polyangiaceae bacterium]
MLPPLIDIGVNLAHAQFRNDRDQVIERAIAAGVAQMIITGTSERSSVEAAALARTRRNVLFSTAGVHPHDAKSCTGQTIVRLKELCRSREVVAVGECGLDFNRNFSPPAVQEEWFGHQLALAAEVKLPVFLHERDAHSRFVAILREHGSSLVGGVVHCFTGSAAHAKVYLDLGFDIGVTGWICDERRGVELRDVVKHVPLDRLMVETDAPFLAPRDMRPRVQRNEPAFLPHVLRAVAAACGKPEAEVARTTTQTAHRLFPKTAPEVTSAASR